MDVLKAILLGLIQGITEFLPISSSGHLLVAKELLGFNVEHGLLFAVAVHLATLLSIFVVFWKDLISLVVRWQENLSYIVFLVVSAIPAGIIGVLFKDYIEQVFAGELLVAGIGFLISSLFLFMAHFIPKGDREVGFLSSVAMGVAQAIAILPGVSRSGSTISTGLLFKVSPEKVVKFAFLMSIIPIGGAAFLEALDVSKNPVGSGEMLLVGVGFITAFVSGIVACRLMINFVTRNKLLPFAIYCLLIGIATLFIAMK
ncbi:MAG: undecaprenyl-diphosphate phosphatase [Chlorobi bacterium]|nr:undecaprenyl-diphosphate phosphatase [Chlorobiota bacterium]